MRRARAPLDAAVADTSGVCRYEEVAIMAAEDKAANKVKEVKGKVKKKIGNETGSDDLVAEGQADQVEGNLKQAGEKVKDAFKK
jgi:uncharacterized protein YjbJ (UPF0337 family)